MNYREAIRRLYALRKRGMRLHLERIEQALVQRGRPHRGMHYAHVAGTNGKGSVCAMLATMGEKAGYRTGLYTSPHLHRFVERIRVDGRPIAESEIARRIDELLRFERTHRAFPELSFYEATTLLAFECFRDAGCELVVLEVGLGGRLDATNVVDPMLTVITRIAHDHMEQLGGTLRSIAREKAGIVKARVPLVTGVTDAGPLSVIEEVARGRRAPMRRLEKEFDFRSVDSRRVEVRSKGHTPIVVELGLDGTHQHGNAAIAVDSAFVLRDRGLRITREIVKSAVLKTKWPARLEQIHGAPSFLLDGAHNPDGCRALRAHLRGLPARRRVLVFGAMKDKNWRGMLRILAPLFDGIVYSPVALDRAAHPEEFLLHAEGIVARSPGDAITRARRAAGPNGEVVVTGSLFLVAEVRAELLHCKNEPLLAM